MTYKYNTIKINNLDYIQSSQYIGDRTPDLSKHEYSEAFIQELIDENGKLQWVIDQNDPMNIYEVPQSLKEDEEKIKKDRAKQEEINLLYSHDEELRMLNSAVLALAEGKPLPQEYLDYRKAVDEILAKTILKRSDA